MRSVILSLTAVLVLAACATAAGPTPSATPAPATGRTAATDTSPPPTETPIVEPSPTPYAGATVPEDMRGLTTFNVEAIEGIFEVASLEVGVDVADIAFVPEEGGYSLWVATWEQQSRLEHWDIYFADKLRELAVGDIFAPRSLAASADGGTLVTADEDDVQLFDPDVGELDFDFEPSPRLEEAAISPTDPNLLAVGYASVDGTVVLIDLATGEDLVVLRHGDYVSDIDFLSNGRYLASAAADGSAKVIDVQTGEETFPYEDIGWIDSVALEAVPDGAGLAGALLATSSEGEIALWDAATGELYNVLYPQGAEVMALDFSPNGELLVSGDRHGVLVIWDVVNGVELVSYNLLGGAIRRVLFSTDGSLLAATTLAGPVWVWAVSD